MFNDILPFSIFPLLCLGNIDFMTPKTWSLFSTIVWTNFCTIPNFKSSGGSKILSVSFTIGSLSTPNRLFFPILFGHFLVKGSNSLDFPFPFPFTSTSFFAYPNNKDSRSIWDTPLQTLHHVDNFHVSVNLPWIFWRFNCCHYSPQIVIWFFKFFAACFRDRR